jgi:hypothetical protein
MAPPPKMDGHEKLRLRSAAYRADKVLPPAVAEMARRELMAWEEYGWRLSNGGLINRVVDEIMKLPLPYQKDYESAVGYE